MRASPSLTILAGVLAALNSAGVALLTPTSVAWADKTTATSNVNGLSYSSSLLGAGMRLASRSMNFAAFCFVMAAEYPGSLPAQAPLPMIAAMTEASALPPTEPTARAADAPVLFDVLLMPNRSLPPLGFALLMAAVSLLSFGAGVTFYLIGAWPVIGFLGLDVALIYIAFRVSFRSMRASETLRLT